MQADNDCTAYTKKSRHTILPFPSFCLFIFVFFVSSVVHALWKWDPALLSQWGEINFTVGKYAGIWTDHG